MRVLITVRRSNATSNPYVDLLEESFGPAVEPSRFTYRRAVFGRYDVLHVQWPEYIFRGSTPVKALVKAVPGFALLLRLWIFGVPVVATVHNLEAHERAGLLERIQVGLLARLTTVNIYLNESELNDMSSGVVVLHGDYPSHTSRPRTRGRNSTQALFFGQVRPYKGVEDLIRAAGEHEGLDLEIAGLALDAAYAESLRRSASGDTSVRLSFGHLGDEELDDLIRTADLVVLPYKKMYNSGAVLLALGNGTPVLIPRSGATSALAQEVGEKWVTLFDSPVSASDIEHAQQAALSIGIDEVPDLSRRDRALVGRLHEKLYRLLLSPGSTRPLRRRRKAVIEAVAADTEFAEHSGLNRGA